MCKKLNEKKITFPLSSKKYILLQFVYRMGEDATRTVRRLEHATMTTGNAANGEEKV
jgi:hypothetical protein